MTIHATTTLIPAGSQGLRRENPHDRGNVKTLAADGDYRPVPVAAFERFVTESDEVSFKVWEEAFDIYCGLERVQDSWLEQISFTDLSADRRLSFTQALFDRFCAAVADAQPALLVIRRADTIGSHHA